MPLRVVRNPANGEVWDIVPARRHTFAPMSWENRIRTSVVDSGVIIRFSSTGPSAHFIGAVFGGILQLSLLPRPGAEVRHLVARFGLAPRTACSANAKD